jgi:flagellar hook-associated protein 3 FlgL
MLRHRSIEAIERSLAGLEEAHARTTTGLRVRTASDDPTAYAGILNADTRLAGLFQYRRNLEAAQARMRLEDNALADLGAILERARELATSQAAGNGTAATRQVAKSEVDQLFSEAVALANTRQGNRYIFGGAFTDLRPVDGMGLVSATRPPVGGPGVEFDEGLITPVNHDAVAIFIDTGALQALQDLATGLGNDSDTAIADALTRLYQAFDGVQIVVGENGARMRQLETAALRIDDTETTVKAARSDLADAEMEVAITELVHRQNALEAAMLSTSRLLSTNLTDYLR